MNEVDEIWRITYIDLDRSYFQFGVLCILVLFLVDRANCPHRKQDRVAAPLGFIGMLHWRELAVGRRNDTRQHGGLRQRDSRQIFSEIGRRRLTEAVNAERTALAHVDFVGIHGENLLFR